MPALETIDRNAFESRIAEFEAVNGVLLERTVVSVSRLGFVHPFQVLPRLRTGQALIAPYGFEGSALVIWDGAVFVPIVGTLEPPKEPRT